jgi:hypothetical protein
MNRLTEDFAIHYGTTYCPNPNEIPDDPKARQEKIDAITDELTINCKKLPDVILDQSHEITEAMWAILTDREGDKLGRLNDIVSYQARAYVEWKVGKG